MITLVGSDVRHAARLIASGQLVAVPTETVYGLAGNALDEQAVTSIFRVKERPSFDPLIVHLSGAEQADQYASFVPDVARKLMDVFWPGPLTVLLEKKSIIPDLVTSGSDRVAMRCPDQPLTLELLSILDVPLAAPSANPFGYVSPTTAQHVVDQLGGHIPYVLDGGPCRVGLESTIVGFDDGTCVIYRQGGIGQERIEAVTGIPCTFAKPADLPEAPGMLSSHYAPVKPLYFGNSTTLFAAHPTAGSAVVCLNVSGLEIPFGMEVHELSHSGDLDEAARNLFSVIRRLDRSDCARILAIEFPERELGRAINDRLRRASVKRN